MDLKQLAQEMKLVAMADPLRIDNLLPNPFGPTHREEEIDGKVMNFNFTMDIFPSLGPFWHLSFSIKGHEPLSPELITKVRTAFFG